MSFFLAFALPSLSPTLLGVGPSERLGGDLVAGQGQPTTLVYIYMRSTNSSIGEP